MNPDVWGKAARIIFAMAPSSAASERVFSLVKTMFGKGQITSMQGIEIHNTVRHELQP